MVFNDVSSSAGLVQDADFWIGTDATKYPLKDKTRSANEWLRKAATWIWQSTGDWEFDDTNQTTLPVAVRDLADLQQDYTLPTSAFKIDRCEVMDSDGNYQLVTPMDKSQVSGESMTEFNEIAGLPRYYDLVGDSLILYPKPSADNTTLTDGIKLYLSRDISTFSTTDTTKVPGFMPYFHRIISVGMAIDYAVAKGMRDKASILKKMIYGDPTVGDQGLKGELKEAYGSRHRNFKNKVRIKVDNRL
jgi:hypothetical protein